MYYGGSNLNASPSGYEQKVTVTYLPYPQYTYYPDPQCTYYLYPYLYQCLSCPWKDQCGNSKPSCFKEKDTTP